MTDEALRNVGPLQFGRAPEGAAPRDRPAAFAVVVRDRKLATAFITRLRTVEGEQVNNRCALFEAKVTGEDASLKIEADHTLQWLDPAEALRVLRHDCHAWAVLAWMRGG